MKTYLLTIRNGQLHHEQVKPDYLSIIGIGAVVVSMLTVIFCL